MGFLSTLGNSLFGKSGKTPVKMQDDNDPRYGATQMDVAGLSGSALETQAPQFQYHFNPRQLVRTPGPAYISPMLQFQEYPRTVVEGWGGIAAKEYFKPFEGLPVTQDFTPIIAGTSGVIHDQIYYQPLADTTSNTVAG